MRISGKLPVLLLTAVLLAGCSQSLMMRGQRLAESGQHDQAINLFYQEIAAHPDSYEAWRELGVVFYGQGELDKAEDALRQANMIHPEARTNLYLGLINEQREKYDEALQSYRAALAQNPKGKVKEYLNAHLDQLIAKKMEREVEHALATEKDIDVASIPDNTVAVADFDAENLPPELAPLARGLAEFTAADLAKVKSLTVVDRLKLDVIQKELELSKAGMVDQASAPRIGRLLGSRHLVTATVMDIDQESLRLDGVVVNTVDSTRNITDPTQGRLKGLFAMQKDFVFQIIDELGVTLTAEERDAIQAVPTESFLAMLAYSRGLDYERVGRLGDAKREYDAAVGADPGFGAARARSQTVSASIDLGGAGLNTSQFAAAVGQLTATQLTSSGLEQRLSGTMRGVINPGEISGIDNPPVVPPQIPRGTATVTVVGDTDAR